MCFYIQILLQCVILRKRCISFIVYFLWYLNCWIKCICYNKVMYYQKFLSDNILVQMSFDSNKWYHLVLIQHWIKVKLTFLVFTITGCQRKIFVSSFQSVDCLYFCRSPPSSTILLRHSSPKKSITTVLSHLVTHCHSICELGLDNDQLLTWSFCHGYILLNQSISITCPWHPASPQQAHWQQACN